MPPPPPPSEWVFPLEGDRIDVEAEVRLELGLGIEIGPDLWPCGISDPYSNPNPNPNPNQVGGVAAWVTAEILTVLVNGSLMIS